MIEVKLYHKDQKSDWDALVSEGKNTSFLFYRDFMEYHSDRFHDFSLTFWESNCLLAAMPANKVGDEVYSHQGLSYGGLMLQKETKLIKVIEVLHQALYFLAEQKVTQLTLKAFPRIYNTVPADELDWALTQCDADLYRRDSTLAIASGDRLKYQSRRTRSIKAVRKLNPRISPGNDVSELEVFWKDVLTPNLLARHGVKPVHSIDEISRLMDIFPQHIQHYNVYVGDKVMAGATMFINENVAHAQYISGTEQGRRNGCLDYLFDFLITQEFGAHTYFDFGNSNEDQGRAVNVGLLDWKEGFGARAISHDFYRINPKNFNLLEKFILND